MLSDMLVKRFGVSQRYAKWFLFAYSAAFDYEQILQDGLRLLQQTVPLITLIHMNAVVNQEMLNYTPGLGYSWK